MPSAKAIGYLFMMMSSQLEEPPKAVIIVVEELGGEIVQFPDGARFQRKGKKIKDMIFCGNDVLTHRLVVT
jgi:ABC-type Fe2+-enterobactin transport system substrate-binding protein